MPRGRARGPAPARQRAVVAVDVATAVAEQQTARLHGTKFAVRVELVLQRHLNYPAIFCMR